MPGSWCGQKCMAAARWADSAQKPRRLRVVDRDGVPGQEAGQHGCRLLQAQAVHRLAHRLHGLAHGVQRAVGVAQQRGGHGHVAAGDAGHLGQIGLRRGQGGLQLLQQRRTGRDDDLAQGAAAALAVQFLGNALAASGGHEGVGHGGGVRGCAVISAGGR
jgi:hypothetical protein